MKAFHNDPKIKQKYLNRVAAHRAADKLVQGLTWDDGKGCAIGCTLEAYDHSRYPTELGIPEMLARLEDSIFEGLSNGTAQAWPERFLRAVEPGVDLSTVGWKFLHWLLTDSLIGAYDHELVRDAVQQCAAVLEPLANGGKVDHDAAESAATSATSAANAAWVAESAAWRAESAESAARSAASAARSAAWSAKSAARSAATSARSAAKSAAWVAAASAANAAWRAAESEAWAKMADKLIELLEGAV